MRGHLLQKNLLYLKVIVQNKEDAMKNSKHFNSISISK